MVAVGVIKFNVNAQQIMVEAFPHMVINLDTLLFTQHEVLGRVDEVLGSIYAPSYSVISDEYIK